MAVKRAAAAPYHTPIQRRAASGITAVALLASGLGLAAGLQLAGAASGTVTGAVFVDADEPGLSGVEVVAVDAAGNRTAPVATGSDGTYAIDLGAAVGEPLGAGPYRVEFAGWPDALHETPLGPGNGSSVQFVDANATDVSLRLSEPDPGAPVFIGNRVWLDRNGNGVQDADEPGINGVTVQLLDADGAVVETTETAGEGTSAGGWQFAIDAETAYTVRFDTATATGLPHDIAPAELEVTTPTVGDDRLDSDLDPAADIAVSSRRAGESDHSLDAGFVAVPDAPVLEVEKLVTGTDGTAVAWYDATSPIEYTVTVTNEGPGALTDVIVDDPATPACAGGPFDLAAGETQRWSCRSDPPHGVAGQDNVVRASGRWEPPYGPAFGRAVTIEDSYDAGVRIVSPGVGVDASVVASPRRGDGVEVTYTYEVVNTGDVDLDLGDQARLADDTCDTIVDAAFHPTAGSPYNVGDLDADGILDVEADAVDFDDSLAREVWQFRCVAVVDPLGPLTNTVTVLATPVEPDGSGIGLSDVSKQDSTTARISESAEPAPTPPTEPASIGDRVWHDIDGDGVQDADEPGVGEVEVDLLDADEVVVTRATTDDAGAFIFDGLGPGRYQLAVHVPDGWDVSPADRGADDTVDSDVSGEGQTPLTTLDPGEDDTSWAAGLLQPASLGGRVWLDADADGIRTDDESDIDGVVVRLVDADGEVIASATTDQGGAYVFDGLAPGRYRVEPVTPTGMQVSSGRTAPLVLRSGERDLTADVGFVIPTVVLSSPEVNTATQLAITGRTMYGLFGLAALLIGLGGTAQIMGDRLGRRERLAP
ncbi:MAG: SdrD B-like domain-containing protein [Acidimicrobiales bacterium]|nr:SdrD B-like domain-containing protein [Acidimicrobiales bacterium]